MKKLIIIFLTSSLFIVSAAVAQSKTNTQTEIKSGTTEERPYCVNVGQACTTANGSRGTYVATLNGCDCKKDAIKRTTDPFKA